MTTHLLASITRACIATFFSLPSKKAPAAAARVEASNS